MEVGGEDGGEGECNKERERGEERDKKGGEAEVEEKEVMKEATAGGIPGVVLKEIS